MNNFKFWLIPGLIVVLALGGLVYFRGKLPEQPIEKPVVVQEERRKPKGFAKPVPPSTQAQAQSDSQAMLDALHSGATSDCEKISGSEELKQECLDNLCCFS